MAKKTIKSDDVLDLVLEDRVVNALTVRISDNIMPQIKQMFLEFRADVKSMMQELLVDMIETQIKPLQEKVRGLTENADIMARRMDDMENEARLDYLILHGLSIPSKSDSALVSTNGPQDEIISTVLTYLKDDLDIQLDKRDISLAYKLPRGMHNSHAPIVLKFSQRHIRDLVLKTRRGHKSPHVSPKNMVYINEFLTRKNSELFQLARSLLKHKKITRTWTLGGRVFIRLTDSPDEKPMRIIKPADLELH